MTTPPLPAYPVQPRPQTWFDRNWKWLVALLLVSVFFIVVSFIAVVLLGVEALIKNSDPYQVAVRRATQSPAVAEKIGNPIHLGWFVSGNVNFSGSEGSVRLSIPISGPKGRGYIAVVGKEHAKRWTFETLEVHVRDDGEPILLPQRDGESVQPAGWRQITRRVASPEFVRG
jgi:Cytochrome oxidase complex assembly protein 1